MPDEKPILVQGPLPMKSGTEFITAFYRLFRGAALYARESVVMNRLARECLQVVNGILQGEGTLLLTIDGDHFFFNHTRVIATADNYLLFKALGREMRKRRIGGIKFSGAADVEHLKDLIYLLSGLEENNEDNYLSVERQLEERKIEAIEVGKLELLENEDGNSEGEKKYSKEVYFRCMGFVREVAESIHQGTSVPIRKARRLMQNAVNAVLKDDATLLGLANIKNYDEYTFNHSVNVAIYAVALGQRVGISKKYLSYLGMAGLFHDVGKMKIPEEILNKTEKLSPGESSILRAHPVLGTEILMRMNEWGEPSARMMEGAFEHHLGYDLTGYPRLTQKKEISLFGRIIAVADFYDALVRPKAGHRFPYVSEKVVGRMLERSGKDIDPAITKVFIHMIGIFPLGTLVLLNTNEMGIVTQAQEDPELIGRPRVCVIYYSDGEYRKEKVVDLAERDEVSGEFKRTIVKTLDPNDYNINTSEFFI